ncbi:hypothetical protein GCM10010974_31850 [Brevibacterium sediminis]|uniref:Uncharacterized protein n=1 Tax=Brevibacterium sediminis TaxID=1857024 RepID=A0ABQ1MUQ0_9MICO|nr:hypothetical protein GCM10010974_31850 [Brevibacterium sediminis]
MQVLQKRITEKVCIFDIPDDCRNRRQTSVLRRAKTPLTHDELEARAVARLLPDYDRLKDTDLTNAVDQFRQQIFIEDRSRLPGVRIDEIDIDLTEFGIRNRLDTFEIVEFALIGSHYGVGVTRLSD